MRDWLAAEAATFCLLGGLIERELTLDQLGSLVSTGIFDELPLGNEDSRVAEGIFLLQGWVSSRVGGVSEIDQKVLANEYFRLFLGVGSPLAPPWESGYFNDRGMAFQRQMIEVRAWYARYGLASASRNSEPDDHIGLELQFLGHLAQEALDHLDSGDLASCERVQADLSEFLAEHPLCWVNEWTGLACLFAREDFYRGLALVISGVLSSVASRRGIAAAHVPIRTAEALTRA